MFPYQHFTALTKIWRDISQSLLAWLYPRRCVGCGRDDTYLCLACAEHLPAGDRWSEHDQLAAAPYRHPAIRRLIWLLKYRGVSDIAMSLATLIHDRLLEDIVERADLVRAQPPYLVIPIPLSLKKERRRGFNQAAIIARALAAQAPDTFLCATGMLQKIKDTPTQVSLGSRSARLANLRGAFRLTQPEKIRGRLVILLDDVRTTGATLDTAAEVLKRAKPLHLIKITVAR